MRLDLGCPELHVLMIMSVQQKQPVFEVTISIRESMEDPHLHTELPVVLSRVGVPVQPVTHFLLSHSLQLFDTLLQNVKVIGEQLHLCPVPSDLLLQREVQLFLLLDQSIHLCREDRKSRSSIWERWIRPFTHVCSLGGGGYDTSLTILATMATIRSPQHCQQKCVWSMRKACPDNVDYIRITTLVATIRYIATTQAVLYVQYNLVASTLSAIAVPKW